MITRKDAMQAGACGHEYHCDECGLYSGFVPVNHVWLCACPTPLQKLHAKHTAELMTRDARARDLKKQAIAMLEAIRDDYVSPDSIDAFIIEIASHPAGSTRPSAPQS